MNTPRSDLVAFCGLYCAACPSFVKGKCAGCQKNDKASWCKVRTCCMQSGFSSCAQCQAHNDPLECKKFNNFIARLFGLVFRSDRAACIRQIGTQGLEGHAKIMAEQNKMTIKKS